MLVYATTAPLLNAQTIALPLLTRALIFSLHLAVGGIVVGAMFPIALRRFRRERVSEHVLHRRDRLRAGAEAFWVAMSLVGMWLVVAGALVSYSVRGVVLAMRR